MSTKKLVALDIDGTLLTYEDVLTAKTRDAVVEAAAADNIHIVLATGRVFADTQEVVRRLGITPDYIVASNGATISAPTTDGQWTWVQVSTFDSEADVRKIAATMPEVAIAVGQVSPDEHFVCWQDFPAEHIPTKHRYAESLDELFIREATGIWATAGPDSNRDEFHRRAIESGFEGTSYSIGHTAWLDVAPQGVSKASALEWVRQRLSVAAEHTYAAGDGTNDLHMLQWANQSGAVEASRPEVIAAANVTIPTPAHHGVAHFLHEYVL